MPFRPIRGQSVAMPEIHAVLPAVPAITARGPAGLPGGLIGCFTFTPHAAYG